MPTFSPRPAQEAVLAYTGGKMGVSAVPGSGKTWTLSQLAARLVIAGRLADEQEVLVVTLVNSAVNNFERRVKRFIQQEGLLPIGVRVRTLHGLSHDIARERPGLVGLASDFQIIDERTSQEILQEAATTWLRAHPYALDDYVQPDMEERRVEWVRRDRWPDVVTSVAGSFIRQAKDLQLTPPELRLRLEQLSWPLPLAEMGLAIYTDYQRALAFRGGVDFDDLIRLALLALRLDEEFLARLRARWPYILEDEAQDSSRLQQEILALLAGPEGNWVRVGDPNQAIYETFTTANPRYLREFIRREEVQERELPDSGRSMPSIIALANRLIDWTRSEHPVTAAREALSLPHIRPTPPDDPQPNPPDAPEKVVLMTTAYTPQEEINAVVKSVASWAAAQAALPEEERETLAVLVPRNTRGFEVERMLEGESIPHHSLLRSTPSTRKTAGALGNVLNYLADPTSARKLATVYRVWRRVETDEAEVLALRKEVAGLLRKCPHLEAYLWPHAEHDWLATLEPTSALLEELAAFREQVCRWQEAVILPIDQLVLTIAQELFVAPAELAMAHKLAVVLRRAADLHPEWRLPELTQELASVARNERKFLGLSEDDTGFDPEKYRGQVVVATMHKAKGLEWDRVYLMSVNSYNFPSALPGDTYISEKFFVRDALNLEAEALAQLAALQPGGEAYQEGAATLTARREYTTERLRLLYVGITRARRALVITWNTGKRGDQRPAIPFVALQAWWETQSS